MRTLMLNLPDEVLKGLDFGGPVSAWPDSDDWDDDMDWIVGVATHNLAGQTYTVVEGDFTPGSWVCVGERMSKETAQALAALLNQVRGAAA